MAKTKQQKQLERRKAYELQRNLHYHQPKPKYFLQIKVPGGWKPAMKFFSLEEVEKHEANVEDLRKRNAADITEAIVIEAKTGEHVKHIRPHTIRDPALLVPKPAPETEQGAKGVTQ